MRGKVVSKSRSMPYILYALNTLHIVFKMLLLWFLASRIGLSILIMWGSCTYLWINPLKLNLCYAICSKTKKWRLWVCILSGLFELFLPIFLLFLFYCFKNLLMLYFINYMKRSFSIQGKIYLKRLFNSLFPQDSAFLKKKHEN